MEMRRDESFLFFLLLHQKRDHTPIAAMVSSIITASVTGKPSSLQIALKLTAHDKNLIETFHNFGVT